MNVTSLIGIAAAVLEAGSLCLGRCGEDTLGLVAIELVGRGADSHDHLGIIVVEAGIVDGQALHAAQFLDGALGGSDIGTDVHVPVFRMQGIDTQCGFHTVGVDDSAVLIIVVGTVDR